MKSFWLTFLRMIGWETDVIFPHHQFSKYIIIVAPHTSNWDFIIGLAYRTVLGLGDVKFLGKQELFKSRFGWLFTRLGGIPVDRKSHHNMVDQVAALFSSSSHFKLAIAPEGTRRKVEKLRTGFYFIALKARVPIIMAALDYGKKSAVFSEPLYPTGDVDKDLGVIYSFYRNVRGKYPDQGLMHK